MTIAIVCIALAAIVHLCAVRTLAHDEPAAGPTPAAPHRQAP